jgi:glycosyltransferase involved in cell wall biosynthesis
MKILVLNYEYPPLGGGAGPVAKLLSEGYVAQKHEVDYITMHFKGFKRNETINGVNIHRIKCVRRKKEICTTIEMISFVFMAIPYVLKLTRKTKYDVVHSHFAIPSSVIALFLKWFRNLDFIISIHGSDIPGYNPDRFTFEHRFTRPLLKLIFKNAKNVVALSAYLKSLIITNVSDEIEIDIIPNGIDTHAIVSYPEKEKRILLAGRVLKRKGFQYVLKAIKELELNDWQIDISGDGPYLKALKKEAEGIKIPVVFHGWLDHSCEKFKNLYLKSKIFCLPSTRENASFALLEAMLTKNAIITSHDTGCKETVADSGILVDPLSKEQIKSALKSLIEDDDKIKDYGEKAYKRVLDLFDWNMIINQYLILLSKNQRLI